MRRRLFRRGRFGAGALLVMLVMAPSAMGASPGDIYADLADGKLDGSYTRAELEAYARDAAVQGYGNPVVPVPTGTGGVADQSGGQEGEESGGVAPAQAPPGQTESAGTLPFTGAELGLFALIGGGLLFGGLLLRASARTGRSNTSG